MGNQAGRAIARLMIVLLAASAAWSADEVPPAAAAAVTTTDATDIDVVIEVAAGGTTKLLQCKYGPSHWVSVTHARKWAVEWIRKVRAAHPTEGLRVVVPDDVEISVDVTRMLEELDLPVLRISEGIALLL